jgi:hypothetical protein
MVATLEAETLLDGRRSAVLAPATILDRIRLTPECPPQKPDDLQLTIGIEVYEVNHVGRDCCRVGEEKSIRSLKTGRRYPMLVTGIRLVDCDALAPDDVAALGYANHEDFKRAWSMLNTPCGWLIHLLPLSTTTRAH